MGMFDSVYLKVKCPYCAEEKERECQTKDLDCVLRRLHKGDNIGDIDTEFLQHDYLDCIAGCYSIQCRVWTYSELLKHGWFYPKHFYLFVNTPMGLITGKYRYNDPMNQ